MIESAVCNRRVAALCLTVAILVLTVTSVFGDEAQPRLVIEDPNHNLGRIFEAEVYSHVFEVKNTGNAELKIDRVKPG